MFLHAMIFYAAILSGTTPPRTTCDCEAVFASAVRDYRGSVDSKSIEFIKEVQSAIERGDINKLLALSSKHVGEGAKARYANLMATEKNDEFFFYGCLDASGRAAGIKIGRHGSIWVQDDESGNLAINAVNVRAD
jgi:hypothetical protein